MSDKREDPTFGESAGAVGGAVMLIAGLITLAADYAMIGIPLAAVGVAWAGASIIHYTRSLRACINNLRDEISLLQDEDQKRVNLAKRELREIASKLESERDRPLVTRQFDQAIKSSINGVSNVLTHPLKCEYAEIGERWNAEGPEAGDKREALHTFRNHEQGLRLRCEFINPCLKWLDEKARAITHDDLSTTFLSK